MDRQTNCPNCGAPITGLKCEYCGTQFFDIAEMELHKPGYLRMKLGDSVNTFHAIPTCVDIHIEEPDRTCVYADDRMLYSVYTGPQLIKMNIELELFPDKQGIYLIKKEVEKKWLDTSLDRW